jgi:hypothetical protein
VDRFVDRPICATSALRVIGGTAHPEVPWRVITDMRNRVSHGYFDIDLDVVWNTPLMPRISRSLNRSGLTDVAALDRRHPAVVQPSTRMR